MDNKGQKAKTRFSIRSKILIGSLSVNLLICLVMGLVLYRVVKNAFVESAADDTLALTQVAAKDMNGNLLNLLEAGSEDSYANTVLREDMEAITRTADVYSIYTVGKRGGSLVYLSMPESENIAIGTAVEPEYAAEMNEAMSSSGYATDYIEEMEDGTYIITAYAPIYDNKGNLVGILGIDYIVDRIVDALHSIVLSIVVIGAVLMAVSVVISSLLANGISRGLRTVNTKLEDLVSNNGDLTQQVHTTSNDEVSDIAEHINNLLEYIRGVISSISGSSKELAHSVDEALQTTVRTNEQLDGVAATMEQMSAAMEETSASLQQVQFSTKKIGEEVVSMNGGVQQGTAYAGDMEKRADEMYKNAERETAAAKDAADRMTVSLNEKIEKAKAVEKISQLTQQILDISSETNLLSLNASIEAARAGEHGRGFAVVAGEISSLATSSAQTAQQIQDISKEVISSVEELVGESNHMVEFVREKTIAGYQQLMDTGVQYRKDAEEISRMLGEMNEASEGIKSSMEVMETAMDDVSTAVEESAKGVVDVATSVSEMSENMTENKQVAGENAEIAQHLDSEVNKFKY